MDGVGYSTLVESRYTSVHHFERLIETKCRCVKNALFLFENDRKKGENKIRRRRRCLFCDLVLIWQVEERRRFKVHDYMVITDLRTAGMIDRRGRDTSSMVITCRFTLTLSTCIMVIIHSPT